MVQQHIGKIDYSGERHKPIVIRNTRPPRNAEELPQDIDGTRVRVYEEPERELIAFTRKQIERMTPEEFAANESAIQEAREHNLIIDDTITPEEHAARDKAAEEVAGRMMRAIELRDTRIAISKLHDERSAARSDFERVKHERNDVIRITAEQRVVDLDRQIKEANERLADLEVAVRADRHAANGVTQPARQEETAGDQQT